MIDFKGPWFRKRKITENQKPYVPEVKGGKAVHSGGRLDIYSETWVFIQAHCEQRLKTLRDQNEGMLPDRETCALRGRIKEIRNILDLPKPKPEVRSFSHLDFEEGVC